MWTILWGHHTWISLHIMAFVFPDDPTEERQKSFVDLLTNLSKNLPCQGCSKHFELYLAEHPVDASCRAKLREWLWRFHNAVNVRLGKAPMSFEDAEKQIIYRLGNTEYLLKLNWAQEMRLEDHKVVKKIQQDFADKKYRDARRHDALIVIFSLVIIAQLVIVVLWTVSFANRRRSRR